MKTKAHDIDIEKVRRDFPVLDKVAFLASAGMGPMPRPAIEAMEELINRTYVEYDPRYWTDEIHLQRRCRSAAASLINADLDEIALVRSTTEGINIFASGIEMDRGDNVVINDMEYPSNTIPWFHQARRRGLSIKVIENLQGKLPLERFADAIDGRTRVVAISHVQFLNGFKSDLKELSKLAHERGALVFVDAIQSLGTMRVDVKELDIDALSAGGYKWLCGPIGTGIAYFKRGSLERIHPPYIWFNSLEEDEFEEIWDGFIVGGGHVRDYETLSKTTKKIEPFPASSIDFLGLAASIEYLSGLGIDKIEGRIRWLTDYLIDRARERGYRVMSLTEDEHRSGIVNFRPNFDLTNQNEREKIENRFSEAGVRVAIRGGGIRAACHVFNTKDDIERLLETIKKDHPVRSNRR